MAWGPSWNARLRQTLQRLEEIHNPDWTWHELEDWMRTHQRLAEATREKYLRQLRLMQEYEAQPVELHGSLVDLVQSFQLYFRARELYDEDTGHGGLINDVKAVKTLGRFLGVPGDVWPKPPTAPRRNDRWLPRPELVWHVLHTGYGPDARNNPEARLVQYLAATQFALGTRGPSELYELRTWDVELDEVTVTVTEPKKRHSRRTVVVEPSWLMNSRTHLSLRNWLEVWRPKLDPDTDQLFPRPDGTEWPTKFALSKHFKDAIQDEHPWWTYRLCRHWCATARLIEWGHDYGRVAEWLGHEKADRVRNRYGRSARVFEQRYGSEWLSRAWQRSPDEAEAYEAASSAVPPGRNDGTGRSHPSDQEEQRTNVTADRPLRPTPGLIRPWCSASPAALSPTRAAVGA